MRVLAWCARMSQEPCGLRNAARRNAALLLHVSFRYMLMRECSPLSTFSLTRLTVTLPKEGPTTTQVRNNRLALQNRAAARNVPLTVNNRTTTTLISTHSSTLPIPDDTFYIKSICPSGGHGRGHHLALQNRDGGRNVPLTIGVALGAFGGKFVIRPPWL